MFHLESIHALDEGDALPTAEAQNLNQTFLCSTHSLASMLAPSPPFACGVSSDKSTLKTSLKPAAGARLPPSPAAAAYRRRLRAWRCPRGRHGC